MISHDEYDELIDSRLDELTEWAMHHGWKYLFCPLHGGYWTDTTDCPTCSGEARYVYSLNKPRSIGGK